MDKNEMIDEYYFPLVWDDERPKYKNSSVWLLHRLKSCKSCYNKFQKIVNGIIANFKKEYPW